MILQRLKGRSAFSEVLQTGKRFTSGPLMVFYRELSDGPGVNQTRIGVAVGKRKCPKATVRNRLKRLLRVAASDFFNQDLGITRDSGFKRESENDAGFDIILMWNANPGHSHQVRLADVFQHVAQVLSKIYK
ncbi:MAG: ribonuclease P protein component [Ignavibacteria bacterium]|nr:ribonuclease P protein component [Ignavibacteria bacterium]